MEWNVEWTMEAYIACSAKLILWPRPHNSNLTSLRVPLTKFEYLQSTDRCSSGLFANGVYVVFVKSLINLGFQSYVTLCNLLC